MNPLESTQLGHLYINERGHLVTNGGRTPEGHIKVFQVIGLLDVAFCISPGFKLEKYGILVPRKNTGNA